MHPVRTAVTGHYEIDLTGVCGVLEKFTDRVQLVQLDDPSTDVILYGLREFDLDHDEVLHSMLRSTTCAVVTLGWVEGSHASSWALSCGADGHVLKTSPATELVNRLVEIVACHVVGTRQPRDSRELAGSSYCPHPAVAAVGLSPRELDVLVGIARGLTNDEIALELYLSINTIKTFVRTAYRKIGANRRTQAATWGLQHGLTAQLPGSGVSLTPTEGAETVSSG